MTDHILEAYDRSMRRLRRYEHSTLVPTAQELRRELHDMARELHAPDLEMSREQVIARAHVRGLVLSDHPAELDPKR